MPVVTAIPETGEDPARMPRKFPGFPLQDRLQRRSAIRPRPSTGTLPL